MENPNLNGVVPPSPKNDDVSSPDSILDEQRREIEDAKALNSDIDLAFNLQMEEAIAASLSQHPSSSSCSQPHQQPIKNDAASSSNGGDLDDSDYIAFLLQDLERLDQERRDREACENLTTEIRKDLDRRIHDQKLAAEISNIPVDEWEEYGDNYHKPYEAEEAVAEGIFVSSERFKVYCKGIQSEEMIREMKVVVGGIGVAICDTRDNVIFEVSKGLDVGGGGKEEMVVEIEIKGLIEGLKAALALDLKRINLFCDDFMVYQYVTGRVQPKQNRILTLVDEVSLLKKKLVDCQSSLVPRNDVQFAFKLAKNAIISQISWDAESSKGKKSMKETCVICYEDKDVGQMFSVDGCLHRYCFSCMKQHVEVKLLNGMEARCPHEGCESEISIENCGQFLDPKLVEIMSQRKKEKSIPVTDKVYCPQMRCSALLSKIEVLEYTDAFFVGASNSGARKCMKCGIFFCINCRVPWHYNMTCKDYKRYNPYPPEDVMLNSLAKSKLWRQCAKCHHIIELAEGCYHITCRCGYEFCYTCGAPWKNKKATCTCKLWDEHNLLHNRRRR